MLTPDGSFMNISDMEKLSVATRDSIPSSDSYRNVKGILCELLGVPRTANESEIRKAYLKFSKRNHPDKINVNCELAVPDWQEVASKYYLYRTLLSDDPFHRTVAMLRARSMMLAIDQEDYTSVKWLMPLIVNMKALPGTKNVVLMKESLAERFAPGFFQDRQYPADICPKTAYGLAVLGTVSKLLPLSPVSISSMEQTVFRVMQRMSIPELGAFFWFLVKYHADDELVIRTCFPPQHQFKPRGMTLQEYTAHLIAAAISEGRIYVAFRAAQEAGMPGAALVILRERAFSVTHPQHYPVPKRHIAGSTILALYFSVRKLLNRYAGLERDRERKRTVDNPECFRHCPFSTLLARIEFWQFYRPGEQMCDEKFRGDTLTAHFLTVHTSNREWEAMSPCKECHEPRLFASEQYPESAVLYELDHQLNCDKAYKRILGHLPKSAAGILNLPDDFEFSPELGTLLDVKWLKVSKPGMWSRHDDENRLVFRIYN